MYNQMSEEHVAHSLALAKWQYLWAGKEESHALNFSISWKSLWKCDLSPWGNESFVFKKKGHMEVILQIFSCV